MSLRHGRRFLLWLTVISLFLLTAPVSAAPPAGEVNTTERVNGDAVLTNIATGFQYRVGFVAERWTNSAGGETQMWMEVGVEVYDADGNFIDGCGDGAMVDPNLFEVFEPDLSHAFLHSGGQAVGGGLGNNCFWQSVSVDTHLFQDGRILNGNSHQREPGWVCSSHNERTSASVEAHFGFGDGPEGGFGIHELDRGEPTRGEIFYDVTNCHAKGSPGPVG